MACGALVRRVRAYYNRWGAATAPSADLRTVTTGWDTPVDITLTSRDLNVAPRPLTFRVTSLRTGIRLRPVGAA